MLAGVVGKLLAVTNQYFVRNVDVVLICGDLFIHMLLYVMFYCRCLCGCWWLCDIVVVNRSSHFCRYCIWNFTHTRMNAAACSSWLTGMWLHTVVVIHKQCCNKMIWITLLLSLCEWNYCMNYCVNAYFYVVLCLTCLHSNFIHLHFLFLCITYWLRDDGMPILVLTTTTTTV